MKKEYYKGYYAGEFGSLKHNILLMLSQIEVNLEYIDKEDLELVKNQLEFIKSRTNDILNRIKKKLKEIKKSLNKTEA